MSQSGNDDVRFPLSSRSRVILLVAGLIAAICVFFDYSDLFQSLVPFELEDGTVDWRDVVPLMAALGALFILFLFSVATIPAPLPKANRDAFILDLAESRRHGLGQGPAQRAAAVYVIDLESESEERKLAAVTENLKVSFGEERVAFFRVR